MRYLTLGETTLRDRFRNATILVTTVTGHYLAEHKISVSEPLFGRYRVAYLEENRDSYVIAIPPLHWILRMWRRHRWAHLRAIYHLGVWEVDEGAEFRTGRWIWPWQWRRRMYRLAAERQMRHRAIGYRRGRRAGVNAGYDLAFEALHRVVGGEDEETTRAWVRQRLRELTE